MFSLKMILIFSVCLTICYQIRSTLAEEYTKIGTLAKRIKNFLIKVKKLDHLLTLPDAIKDFKKINFKDGLFWSIKSNNTYLDKFRTEYDKLKTYSVNVINSLMHQMDNILLSGYWAGTQPKRIKLCDYYVTKFSTKLAIKGAGAEDPKIVQIYDILKTNLHNLYLKIYNMAAEYENANQQTTIQAIEGEEGEGDPNAFEGNAFEEFTF